MSQAQIIEPISEKLHAVERARDWADGCGYCGKAFEDHIPEPVPTAEALLLLPVPQEVADQILGRLPHLSARTLDSIQVALAVLGPDDPRLPV